MASATAAGRRCRRFSETRCSADIVRRRRRTAAVLAGPGRCAGRNVICRGLYRLRRRHAGRSCGRHRRFAEGASSFGVSVLEGIRRFVGSFHLGLRAVCTGLASHRSQRIGAVDAETTAGAVPRPPDCLARSRGKLLLAPSVGCRRSFGRRRRPRLASSAPQHLRGRNLVCWRSPASVFLASSLTSCCLHRIGTAPIGNRRRRRRHDLVNEQMRIGDFRRLQFGVGDDDARTEFGELIQAHCKIMRHADAAVRSAMADVLALVERDARPGDALHEWHRRAAVDVRAVKTCFWMT